MREGSAGRLLELKALTNLRSGRWEAVTKRKCSCNLTRTEKEKEKRSITRVCGVCMDMCVNVCVCVCVAARDGDKRRDMLTPVTLRVFKFLQSAGGPH